MMFNVKSARALLTAANVFYGDDDGTEPEMAQTLNLNDALFWGCADEQYVEDEALPRVAELFFHYGWNGILAWVALRRGYSVVEFEDVNRGIQFVLKEEEIKAEEPDSSRRAYLKKSYVIGQLNTRLPPATCGCDSYAVTWSKGKNGSHICSTVLPTSHMVFGNGPTPEEALVVLNVEIMKILGEAK